MLWMLTRNILLQIFSKVKFGLKILLSLPTNRDVNLPKKYKSMKIHRLILYIKAYDNTDQTQYPQYQNLRFSENDVLLDSVSRSRKYTALLPCPFNWRPEESTTFIVLLFPFTVIKNRFPPWNKNGQQFVSHSELKLNRSASGWVALCTFSLTFMQFTVFLRLIFPIRICTI